MHLAKARMEELLLAYPDDAGLRAAVLCRRADALRGQRN